MGKILHVGAVAAIEEAEKDALLKQGHVMIPSKCAHVDKNEFKKHAPDYQPKWKSRLVSCGNFKQTEGIRSLILRQEIVTFTWSLPHGLPLLEPNCIQQT